MDKIGELYADQIVKNEQNKGELQQKYRHGMAKNITVGTGLKLVLRVLSPHPYLLISILLVYWNRKRTVLVYELLSNKSQSLGQL